MAKVTVMCGVQQGLLLTLHKPIDFGKGVVQTRLINEPVALKPGPNPGIDKAFFDAWREQNANLSVMPLITAQDEPESGPQQQGAESAAPGGAKTMDLDAQATHVRNLIKFRERTEKVLDWVEAKMKAEADGPARADTAVLSSGASITSAEVVQLRADLTEMGEHVASVQSFVDEVRPILDGLRSVRDMYEWFHGNREGLELLLTMGDAQPGDKLEQLTGLSSGPAASHVDVDQSGSAEFHPSTEGAAGPSPTAIPAAPGPAPETGGQGAASLIAGADVGTGLAPAAGGPGGSDVANLADAAARGGAGAPVAEVGANAAPGAQAGPEASLTAAEVIKDPNSDPSTSR